MTLAVLSPAAVESAPAYTVSTRDGLTLGMTAAGEMAELRVEDRPLAGTTGAVFFVEEMLPPDGKRKKWGAVPGVVSAREGGLRFAGVHTNAAPALRADLAPAGERGYLAVDGEIQDLTGRERALFVTFKLPLRLAGWRWENTAFRSETIEAGRLYPETARDMLYLDRVGPRQGRDPMASGLPVNKVPYTVVAGPEGALALAMPVHEPRAFLIRAGSDGLRIRYTLGLTPETKHHVSSAPFRAMVYRVDPAWGMRSAAERYQGFFPDFFSSTNRRHGNYTHLRTFNPNISRSCAWPESAEDFGFLFAENDFQTTNGEMRPAAAAEVARLRLLPFHWRGPWYYFHGVEEGITPTAQLALLKAQAEGRAPGAHGTNNQLCGCPNRTSAQGAYNSYLVNSQGRLDRGHYPSGYGCYLMGMNMNPDIPRPNRASLALDWQYRFIKRWDQASFRGPSNFAWDALDDWGGHRRLNFRREHFKYERVPLVCDKESGRLCILNGFTHWAFARLHAGLVRAKGGLIMCNANSEEALLFCAPYIDVEVKERPASLWDDERLWVERALAGPKPISFLGNLQPKENAAFEAVIRKLLLFGMAPGTRGTEAQRPLLKKYMPVLQEIGYAGWQPVTHARASGLCLERLGAAPGPVYFAMANRGEDTVQGRVRMDTAALLLEREKTAVTELVENRAVTVSQAARGLEAVLEVRAGETLVLKLAPPTGPQERANACRPCVPQAELEER
jgi:hypothetical protein